MFNQKSKKDPVLSANITNIKERKYWEIWGDVINMSNFLKIALLFSIMLNIFLSIITKKSLNKSPLVIRVDSLGNASAFENIESDQYPSAIEISNFTQYFLQYFTSYNYYTYDEDFTRAFRMMTRPCQIKLNDYLTTAKIVDTIKNEQLKIKVIISEIVTVKDSPEFSNLKIKGVNEVRSYKNPEYYKEEIFEYELTINKVKRSEQTPWGLLVDSFGVSFFKR